MSTLNKNQIEKLLPVLKLLVTVIKKRGCVSEDQIEIFLDGIDLSNEDWAKIELGKWSKFLIKYFNSDSDDNRESIEMTLEARGIPLANLTLALSELNKKKSVISKPIKRLSVSVNGLNFGQLEIGEKKELTFFVEGGPGSIENEIQYLRFSKTNFGTESQEIKAIIFGGIEGEQIADSINFRTENEIKEITVLAEWKVKKYQLQAIPNPIFVNHTVNIDKRNYLREIEEYNEYIAVNPLIINNEVIKHYKKPLLNNSQDSITYENLGIAYQIQGRLEQAIEEFEKSISVDPKKSHFYNDLGNIYSVQGNLDKAIEYYEKACSINVQDSFSFLYLGLAYLEKRRINEAIEQFKKVISIKPKDPYGYLYLGLANYEQEHFEEAIKQYNKAISIKTNFAQAYNNLGNVYLKQGKLAEAIKKYEKAILINPDFIQAYKNLGDTYSRQEKLKDAIEVYKKAIFINHISIFNEEKRKQMSTLFFAIESFEKIISLNPQVIDIYIDLGVAFRKQGKLEDAVEQFKKAIAIKPKEPYSYIYLGLSYFEQGNFEKAIEQLQKGNDIKPGNNIFSKILALTYFEQGKAYASESKKTEANECMKKASDLGSEDARIWIEKNKSLIDKIKNIFS